MLGSIEHIRESGLLELYVIGELTPTEVSQVEAALELYPVLKSDVREIEKALHTYAEAHAIQAPKSVLNKVLSQTNTNNKSSVEEQRDLPLPRVSKLLLFTLFATLGTLLYQLYDKNSQEKSYADILNTNQEKCDEEKQILIKKIALYKELENIDNRIINVTPTEKYPETQIIFNTNEVTKRNFLQFKFLPELESNQSYQLWSLKGDSDPIPLNVFEDVSELLEVEFVDDTNAYAITIEPKGGQQSPTLENLIGVFSIAG